ncbi:hypothetical protein LTR27_012776 [Elasticomyces elasticus]|nr:hypothetical protein LTR27_012776 [Elasticomyces elasticus]
MLFDERFLGANATHESRDAWAEETWPRITLVWGYMILLHFARLLPIDPVVVHWLSVILRRVSDTASPVNEDDGDTEDDSHISRVLRAYYTEKGRPCPPWLPPDPNDRRAITPQPSAQPNSGYFTSAGGKSQYSGVQNAGGQRGSLSDLWDAPAQPAAPMQPQSLRAGRRVQPTSNPSSTLAPPVQARPLPSQRAGSHQAVQVVQAQRPGLEQSPPSSSGGGTAQDRLKARLWGGSRSGSAASSPALSSVGAPNPYDQPAANAPSGNGGGYSYDQPSANAPWSNGGGNPYDTGGGGNGAGGGINRRYGRPG